MSAVLQVAAINKRFNEKEVAQLLMKLGFQPNTMGYYYILHALEILSDNPRLLMKGLHSEIYSAIARTYDTTVSRVERAIRHAIQSARLSPTPAWSQTIAQYNTGKITNGWFLGTLAEIHRLKIVT